MTAHPRERFARLLPMEAAVLDVGCWNYSSMYGAEAVETAHLVSRGVRLRFPWLLAKAWLRRDAAMLEDVVWRAFGFAVFGTARKAGGAPRRYVLP